MSGVKPFVREATGLIREAGLFDIFAINYGFTGSTFSLWLAFIMGQAMWAYPGGDFGVASLITIVPTILFVGVAYAFLSITMPRTGGDYVYMSRLVYPSVGFAMSFTIAIMLAFFVAFGSYWGAGLAVSTFLATIGYYTGNQGLVSASTALQATNSLFALSTVLIIIFGLIVMSGLKNYLRLNNALFIVGSIGMIIGLGLLASTTPDAFAARFNKFMLQFTTDKNYYQTVISQAQSLGWNPTPAFSWPATLRAYPIAMSSIIYCYGSAYIGGEVKQVSRNQLIGIVSAVAFLGICNAIVYWVSVNAVGFAFQSSINYLWWQAQPLALPLWPFFNLWITLSTDNVALAAIAGLGFIALAIMYVPMNIMLVTRMIFAWSFDRVFPEKLSEVSERTKSPIWAVVFVMIIAEIFLAVISYTTWLYGLAGIAGSVSGMFITFLAAVLLPRRGKKIYDASPISKYRVGGAPLISLLGVGGMLTMLSILIPYLIDPLYLVNSPSSISTIAGTIVLGFVVYYVSKGIRKTKGIDIDLAFKDIPPE